MSKLSWSIKAKLLFILNSRQWKILYGISTVIILFICVYWYQSGIFKSKYVAYTFSNPNVYEGPILKGWPPNASRNVRDYISTGKIQNDLPCLDLTETKVLIIIQSGPRMILRRESNRETFMKYQDDFPMFKTIFLFGKDPDKSEFYDNLVDIEFAEYCDIVQMDFIDSYQNVTLDTLFAIEFARSYDNLDFVVIGDDDVYLNIPKLWKLLYEDQIIHPESNAILGDKIVSPKVFKPSSTKYSRIKKYEVPSYMYDGDYYPDFLSGFAYVLPFYTLDCLFEKSLNLPLFHLNDVFVTGFAAEECQIERVDHEEFHYLGLDLNKVNDDVVAIHYTSEDKKAFLYSVLANK